MRDLLLDRRILFLMSGFQGERYVIDLSQFDSITDRVARAKAKAEAVRNAKESGDADAAGGEAPSTASLCRHQI